MVESAPKPTGMLPSPIVRVVSYNVLSSHLCGADHYTACAPEDLDPPTRLRRVQEQLRPHIDAGAVLCLQELSDVWVGALVPYFEERGYTLVSGRYGRKFNGYMFPYNAFLHNLECLGFCQNDGITNLMPIVMYCGDE